MSDETLPATAGIGRVALRVADLDAVVSFYRDVVGLALLDRPAIVAHRVGVRVRRPVDDENVKPRTADVLVVPPVELLTDALYGIDENFEESVRHLFRCHHFLYECHRYKSDGRKHSAVV